MGNARALYEEAQRARAEESKMLLVGEDTAREIEALEAKLREAEAINSRSIAALGGDYAPEQVPEAIKQAFALMEKVELERDEARAALRVAALRVHRMSPYHDDDPDTCEHEECSLVRAALGEKP